MPVARVGLIVNLIIPLAILIWDAHQQALGVNAVNFAIHTTGGVAVVLLLLSLAVTPLRTLTGFTWLIQFRRSLGVYGFYYAVVHLVIYIWWDRQGSLSSAAYEITHRYYLTIGFASLALMAPLWATSFNAAIQKMGPFAWKRLHRLAYVAAALGCYHFYLQTKADKRLPDVAIAVLAGLFLWRTVAAISRRVRKSKTVVTTAQNAKAHFWKGELRVIGMFRETAAVRTFRLATPDGGSIPFTFRAGQFLNLVVDIDGKHFSRSYTIASPPTRDSYIELTIKREDNGQVSRFLHDMPISGQTVTVSAPAGRFSFDPLAVQETGVLLIAGGVGITPVMSILRDLTDRCWPGKIDLVFTVRTSTDVIFAEELHLLASRYPNLHIHFTVTRDVAGEWSGHRGRITRDLLRAAIPDLTDRPAFICGPDAMAKAAREELLSIGVLAERIKLESFTPGSAVDNNANTATSDTIDTATSVTITFLKSKTTARLARSKTILEAAENVGVQIDSQCRSGICGTCRTKLSYGRVTMDVRDALSDADEAEGYILACQAHAAEDVGIDG